MTGAPSRRGSAVVVILTATLIAGVISYLITWLVPRVIGFSSYAEFALFWSALYLVIGTLSGVQQEITRATRAIPEPVHVANRARRFGLVAMAVVGGAVLLLTFLVGPVVFPRSGASLAVPLAIGPAGYVAVAVLSGTLYGLANWRWIAGFIVTDAVLRLLGVGVVLLVTDDVLVLAWAVVLPFPLTFVLLWPGVRRRVVGRAQLDVGFRRLTSNVLHTVAGAAATSVMVSGFPLALGLTTTTTSALLGMIILAVTFVRAPFVIVAMSLQSYLILRFRERAPGRRALILGAAAGIGVGVVLAALGALAGPPVFTWLFPGELVPDPLFIAALCGSSVLVAALYVTGALVLAAGNHRTYVAGWAVGAVATVGLLLVPIDVVARTSLALCLAPMLGVATHLVLHRLGRRGP